jgi:peptidoglycan/xylan/chitin deacetylase (PgdA/CDA1 family)
MKFRGARSVRLAVKQILKRFHPGAVILLYHRVTEVDTDPWQLCVTPRHFAEHLEVLRKHFNIVTLQKLALSLKDGKLPHRAVVITFDDGYADNLVNAKPTLEEYDAPATIFITTGYLGHKREYWWDELDKLLLQPGTLPETLRLRINEDFHEWQLGNAARYSDAAFQSYRHWNASENTEPSPRQYIYRSLWQLMHPLREHERQKLRDDLISWSGRDAAPRSTHRSLSRDELCALAQGGLVEIGCHTVTHPALSTIAPSSQEREIRESKACLEEVLGHSVTSFAYPYGRSCDYTEWTVSLVREAGFSCACSTSATLVRSQVDCFKLPRFHVPDCNGEELDKHLMTWLGN